MHSCKSLDKHIRQARMLTEGIWIEIFLSCPRDLLARALIWFSPEKCGWGQPPVNTRRVGERHKIVKTDRFWFWDRCSSWSKGVPRILICLWQSDTLRMTFAMGGTSRGGSRHFLTHFYSSKPPSLLMEKKKTQLIFSSFIGEKKNSFIRPTFYFYYAENWMTGIKCYLIKIKWFSQLSMSWN